MKPDEESPKRQSSRFGGVYTPNHLRKMLLLFRKGLCKHTAETASCGFGDPSVFFVVPKLTGFAEQMEAFSRQGKLELLAPWASWLRMTQGSKATARHGMTQTGICYRINVNFSLF